jgi:hypothetical protein
MFVVQPLNSGAEAFAAFRRQSSSTLVVPHLRRVEQNRLYKNCSAALLLIPAVTAAPVRSPGPLGFQQLCA